MQNSLKCLNALYGNEIEGYRQMKIEDVFIDGEKYFL
jgi:hypothetical protein